LASRRSHLTLVVIILAALGGVVALALPGSPAHKGLREGLDLQGGLEVVLKAQPQRGQQLTSQMMSNSINIIRQRIDKLGVAEPNVTQQGQNEIDIQLPAVHDINQAAQIIGSTARLELYDLETALVPPSIDANRSPQPATKLFDLLASVQSGQKGTPAAYYLFRTKGKKLLAPKVGAPAVDTRAALLKPYGGKVPKGDVVMAAPAKRIVITCDAATSVVCPGPNQGITPSPKAIYYYLF
jgi:preprotein translocase subunit SecD